MRIGQINSECVTGITWVFLNKTSLGKSICDIPDPSGMCVKGPPGHMDHRTVTPSLLSVGDIMPRPSKTNNLICPAPAKYLSCHVAIVSHEKKYLYGFYQFCYYHLIGAGLFWPNTTLLKLGYALELPECLKIPATWNPPPDIFFN